MNRTSETELVEVPVARETTITSRIVFTQGGKGGVGKTAFTSLLVEWYARQNLRYSLLDLDTENKTRGSLGHFFPHARKVNVHTSEGLDAFVDVLDEGAPLVIADMGAGAGAVAHRAGAVRGFPSERLSPRTPARRPAARRRPWSECRDESGGARWCPALRLLRRPRARRPGCARAGHRLSLWGRSTCFRRWY